MTRREFITLLGGAAAAWPLSARAQLTYRVGILSGRSRDEPNFAAFFEELRQAGIVEGQQLTVDPRGFSTREDRYPALAVELVASGADAILAAGDAAIADRITRCLLHLLTTGYGTSRRFAATRRFGRYWMHGGHAAMVRGVPTRRECPMYGPAVCCKKIGSSWRLCGLAPFQRAG
jgi:hypothetical protein